MDIIHESEITSDTALDKKRICLHHLTVQLTFDEISSHDPQQTTYFLGQITQNSIKSRPNAQSIVLQLHTSLTSALSDVRTSPTTTDLLIHDFTLCNDAASLKKAHSDLRANPTLIVDFEGRNLGEKGGALDNDVSHDNFPTHIRARRCLSLLDAIASHIRPFGVE
ncbi:hypothetical protein CPB85DRAFT_438811 [Mucidula mucida]|nr:hypothetical protein CPB85DRAFT_438811 [Mucidula mucida]